MGRAERVPPTGTRKSALRRWRGADIFLMPALVQARRRVWGGGTRFARSPYGHEHNDMLERERKSGGTRPAGDAFPLRALAECGTLRGEEGSPVGRAERVPPTGTRKSASADGVMLSFFLCPRSCKHGAGHKKNARTPSE